MVGSLAPMGQPIRDLGRAARLGAWLRLSCAKCRRHQDLPASVLILYLPSGTHLRRIRGACQQCWRTCYGTYAVPASAGKRDGEPIDAIEVYCEGKGTCGYKETIEVRPLGLPGVPTLSLAWWLRCPMCGCTKVHVRPDWSRRQARGMPSGNPSVLAEDPRRWLWRSGLGRKS